MDGSCIDETSSSSDSIQPPPPPQEKLCRVGSGASTIIDAASDFGIGIEAESTRKLPSSKYKGVVPQPNGRWGAQIYEKHQRVWLGTFNQEIQAAVAYDTAVQRFRGRDAVTNFKPLSETDVVEISFLNSHSKAEIVDMLRKHTYNDELEQSRRSHVGTNHHSGFHRLSVGEREQLFEKVVTPSDVGKLNRLVIPKQQAEKHFPLRKEAVSKGVLLNFEDEGGKVWRFRYSYWNSSQSYVLTKGWSRFVKEKGLQAGDVVCFKRSGGSGQNQHQQHQLYIEWKLKGRDNNNNNNNVVNCSTTARNRITSSSTNGIRLFGVNIFEQAEMEGKNKRRGFELECSSNDSSKKPKLINVL